MKDVILLPTYNERENIKLIIPEIFKILPDIYILVIDDSSPDGTALEVKSLMSVYPRLSLLERAQKTGLGNAYKQAMTKVMADPGFRSIITMDADGSHEPKYLVDFMANIGQYDLIIGSRYVKGGGVANWESWRKFLSSFGNLYARILTGLPVHDLTAGFMCYKKDYLARVDFNKISSVGYSFQIELKFYLIHYLHARVCEVPIIFMSRREGESKISNQIIGEGLRAPWRLFWKRLWKK